MRKKGSTSVPSTKRKKPSPRSPYGEPEENFRRFSEITFEQFRTFAQDTTMSRYEKIGFPDSYRKGREKLIFKDILRKIAPLRQQKRLIMDIGPGCSDLPRILIGQCRKNGHHILLVDSKEMLDHLPDGKFISKYPGIFPSQCQPLLKRFKRRVDAILVYSVLHYVFVEGNLFDFLDRAVDLLAPQGVLLVADIPNISKRKRFFSSQTGVRYHKKFMKTNKPPEVLYNQTEHGKIDDAVVFSILMRYREAGFDAYVLPQEAELPMANRREDILIQRP